MKKLFENWRKFNTINEIEVGGYTKGTHEKDKSGILNDEAIEDFFNASVGARKEKGANERVTQIINDAKWFIFNVIDYGHAPENSRGADKYNLNAEKLKEFINQYMPAMLDGDDSLREMEGYKMLMQWNAEN